MRGLKKKKAVREGAASARGAGGRSLLFAKVVILVRILIHSNSTSRRRK